MKRIQTIAGALSFFELLAPKVMAADAPHITTLDLAGCEFVAGYPKCPFIIPKDATGEVYVILPRGVLDALKKAKQPTSNDLKAIEKSIESKPAPASVK